jgi:hypothetical protein
MTNRKRIMESNVRKGHVYVLTLESVAQVQLSLYSGFNFFSKLFISFFDVACITLGRI